MHIYLYKECMADFIKPTSDIVIHYLLGSEHNKDLLLSFINAVLEDADMPLIDKVEIKNPFNIKHHTYDKMSILDLKAEDESGKTYNIEVQLLGNEFFANRSLYYWAKNYSAQLGESSEYHTLLPVICINILEFNLIEDLDKVHTCFLPIEKDNNDLILTDHLEIHFIELKKFDEKKSQLKSDLAKWIQYFKYEGKENEAMKTILHNDSVIKKAHKEYINFTGSDEYRELYEARQKWIRDQATLVYGAREEGKKEGVREGNRERALTIAKKLLNKGVAVEEVADMTGLEINEVKKIKI
jgi:predicted transposase/invertase (TIGR01784 family)